MCWIMYGIWHHMQKMAHICTKGQQLSPERVQFRGGPLASVSDVSVLSQNNRKSKAL